MKSDRKKAGTIWIALGLLLIAAALCFAVWNMAQSLQAQEASDDIIAQLEPRPREEATQPVRETVPEGEEVPVETIPVPDYVRFPEMEMPVQRVRGIDYIGVLRIPALDLELPVGSWWSHEHLQVAPCRYVGSAYLHNLIICAHNFPSHFGNLKNLTEGDLATFTDMDGNVFTYRMVEREMIQPTDFEGMESGDWDLTLFTCTVGGQLRVTIRFAQEAP